MDFYSMGLLYFFVTGPRRVSLRAVSVEHDPKAPAAHSDRREKGELISGSVYCIHCSMLGPSHGFMGYMALMGLGCKLEINLLKLPLKNFIYRF